MPLTERLRRTESIDTSACVVYSNKSCVTGRNIGRFLGVPHGKECDREYDYVVRWGTSSSIRSPSEGEFNSRRAVNSNTDKLGSLRTLRDAGINVPEFSTTLSDIGYPALGRQREHTQGNDIELILQERDRYLTENDFFVEYVPTQLEYRVHVFNGEVIKVHEKRKLSDAENHAYIRNSDTGYIFVNPRDDPTPSDDLSIGAVEALGLDFGAVDVIREEDTRDEYVLEVNTAPSLDEANLRRYGEQFAQEIGISDYPGLDAESIELPSEDEDD